MGSNAMSHAHHFLETVTDFVLPEFLFQENHTGTAVVLDREHKPEEELLVANSIPVCLGRWEESWILIVELNGKNLPVPVNRELYKKYRRNDKMMVRYKQGRHPGNFLVTAVLP